MNAETIVTTFSNKLHSVHLPNMTGAQFHLLLAEINKYTGLVPKKRKKQ